MHSDQGSLTATDVYRRLRAAGYRLTAPRRALVDALLAADAPLGAEELHARVNGSGLNLSTVYRNLSKFVSLGWVETVPGLNGERRFGVRSDPTRCASPSRRIAAPRAVAIAAAPACRSVARRRFQRCLGRSQQRIHIDVLGTQPGAYVAVWTLQQSPQQMHQGGQAVHIDASGQFVGVGEDQTALR